MSDQNAVIPADSAPAQATTDKLTPEQSQTFWETGELPHLPSKPDSAPGKKDAVADSAPQKKSAVTAPDSAPEKDTQKPHRKPEDYGERRFQELANENKTLRERLDALERRPPEKRDTQQTSQPAPEEPKAPAPLKQFLEKFFADNKGKSYEEGVEAWQEARDKFKDAQSAQRLNEAIASDRRQRAQESAAKDLQAKLNDANERYGKEETQKIFPALEKVVGDAQIPVAVKAMIDRSDVVVDLMYTLASNAAEFDQFLALCKSDPGAAIEKVVVTQSLVREQLKSNTKPVQKPLSSEANPGKEAPVEPKPRAPKPPAEVSGRDAPGEAADRAAARSGNFSAFEAEQRRKYFRA